MIREERDGETLEEFYSSAWTRYGDGVEPSAADFLADHPDASASERLDVLLADQWLRWRGDRPKPVQDYLAEHPSLANDTEGLLKLIHGEFLARLERGEEPELSLYEECFPDLAEAIRLQCEVERWLTMPAPPGPSMVTTEDYRADGRAERAGDDVGRPAPGATAADDPAAPLAETDFELGRPLGSGGMGEVHEAVQKSLRKRVALKLIHREALDSPSRVRRFFAEGRALARLRHPHIVGVHGIGRMADGRYFLVMDLVEGGTTLAGLLRRGTVPFDRVAGLVATVAEAIEHAHSRGVIHRDLKPSNVLLDAEGQPHVTDFGLAKIFDAANPDDPQTTADRILGTPHYMAPEQADPARGPITPRTDVYALGGLLYALLTGRPPIQGDSLTAILTRVVSAEPIPTPRDLRADVPTALEQICRTCLEKDAARRCPSAARVAAELRAWLANPEADDPSVAAADAPGRTTGSSHDTAAVRSQGGWTTDRSLKGGSRTPNPGRWTEKAARSQGPDRSRWVAGATASTLALLLIGVIVVRTGLHLRTEDSVAIVDSRMDPTKDIPPRPPEAPAAPPPKVGAPVLAPREGTDIRAQKVAAIRSKIPADLVTGWDVHVYRPDTDGKTWLDLGNLLETPVAIRPGDRVKLRATFREPVHAAVLAINPDGSVQRLGAPAQAGPEQPVAELTIPPGVDRYLRLTDPGPTALVLLASRRPLDDPVRIGSKGLDPVSWRADHADRTWIYDGQAVVPVLRARSRTIEESVGTRPFATIGESLKADPGLDGSRAVLFEVAPSK
jgi:serine/threonine protein kinase